MKSNAIRHATWWVMFLVTLFFLKGFVPSVHAADVKVMLKQLNKELRQANKDMFGGKAEKAIASLENIKKHLLEVKEADPNSPQVKSYENKYKKLVKDLERRTGQDLGGGTLTAAQASTKADLPPTPKVKPVTEKKADSSATAQNADSEPVKGAAPESVKATEGTSQKSAAAKLPYNARRPMEIANRDLQMVESSIKKLSNPKMNADQLIKNMNKYLENAQKNLQIGREEAAKKGVNSHPDFDALEAGIREAKQKIAQAEEGVAESKEKAAASAEEVNTDVEVLKVSYDRAQPVFEKATGSTIYYNDLAPAKTLLEQIEQFEKTDLPEIKRKLAAFGEKYGTTKDEIDQKADAMGYVNNYYRASFFYLQLAQGIENVQKTRTVMADDLIRRAGEMKTRTSKGIHDFARLKQHARIIAWGETAARFDPDNPRVKEFNDGVKAWVAADTKALNAKIDKAGFPKTSEDAPKDAATLAEEAKVFLQKEEDKLAAEKGKEVSQVLAVVVTGPWRVFKKNILGEPVQYNLPIATAVQTKTEKEQNLARVYLSTMLTHEMKGVKKAPPYLGATVGDSYYIRPAALK